MLDRRVPVKRVSFWRWTTKKAEQKKREAKTETSELEAKRARCDVEAK